MRRTLCVHGVLLVHGDGTWQTRFIRQWRSLIFLVSFRELRVLAWQSPINGLEFCLSIFFILLYFLISLFPITGISAFHSTISTSSGSRTTAGPRIFPSAVLPNVRRGKKKIKKINSNKFFWRYNYQSYLIENGIGSTAVRISYFSSILYLLMKKKRKRN